MHPNPVSNRPAVRSNRFRQQSSKGLFSGRAILCNFLAWRFYDFQSDGWLSLVEGTGFENRRTFTRSGGSNPSPSARTLFGVFSIKYPDIPATKHGVVSGFFYALRVTKRVFGPSTGGEGGEATPKTQRISSYYFYVQRFCQ